MAYGVHTRLPVSQKVSPITVGLGGVVRRLDERCDLTATIDGLEFDMMAYVVKDLGETECGRLDAIVGALTMEEWYTKLDPRRSSPSIEVLIAALKLQAI